MTEAETFRGSCHCGRLSLEFTTRMPAADFHPRACDCSFCCKHGAAYVSDPEGWLSIRENEAGSRREYRQGAEIARFQVCGHCGVLIAVVFEHEGRRYGAVNARCLDGHSGFGESVLASPQRLNAEEKIARWRQAWVPDVTVTSVPA